jgi:3' terminal RNA ribose 2'-O-methyltransferase Hen1
MHTAAVFLTITTTAPPATDLGFLLHKNPDRAHTFDLSVGRAHVFYPEASEQTCTAALLLEVDPIELVRGKRSGAAQAFSLAQYVNDRPYAASSLLAVALARVFSTAMNGRCAARPELSEQQIPLDIRIPALPCRGGVELAERVFGPLGWTVQARPVVLDPTIPAWGDSHYLDLRLSGALRLADALTHLYVLLPVLDSAKHYWVSRDEVDKLLRTAGAWLAAHPERELITARYLAHDRELVLSAVGRLAEVDGALPETLDDAVPAEGEPTERQLSLAAQRRGAVLAVLRSAEATSVLDLGCGEGALIRDVLRDSAFSRIVGADVSDRALGIATRRLRLDRLPERQRQRISLIQASLTYRDERLAGFDAAVLMEVIEHVDPQRLAALVTVVFGHARPRTVVVTTPNVEHNVRYAELTASGFRHRDHRFEWSREQFHAWASDVSALHGYMVRFLPIGPDDSEVGPPTQAAVFTVKEQT